MAVLRVAATGARGVRLDQFLARQWTAFSRSRLQALIDEGHVRLDGAPAAAASFRLKGTEQIELEEPAPIASEPEAEDLPLEVLYQDRDLLVLDKAAGMVVHPGAGHASGTLVNALLHHVTDLQGVGGALRPGLVHRLDKDTSGVLVVAKNDQALRALQGAFKSRSVEKRYLALVAGQPPDSGTIETLHGRHPKHRQRFTGKVKVGRPAITHYQVTRRYLQGARVEVRLETGRTHQIRVHLSELGFPILGDELYGTKASLHPELIGRQALHAWKLSFPHPRTGKAMHFEAPIPADLKRAEKAMAATTARS